MSLPEILRTPGGIVLPLGMSNGQRVLGECEAGCSESPRTYHLDKDIELLDVSAVPENPISLSVTTRGGGIGFMSTASPYGQFDVERFGSAETRCAEGTAVRAPSDGIPIRFPALGWSLSSLAAAEADAKRKCSEMLAQQAEADIKATEVYRDYNCKTCWTSRPAMLTFCQKVVRIGEGESRCQVVASGNTSFGPITFYWATAIAPPGVRTFRIDCKCPWIPAMPI